MGKSLYFPKLLSELNNNSLNMNNYRFILNKLFSLIHNRD